LRVAIITDQHFGARNDSLHFLDFYEKFYDETFFPAIDFAGITTLLILGDTFDRLFDKLADRGIKVHMLVGNHDTYYKNTNDVNSPRLVLEEYDNINIIKNPDTLQLDGVSVCMMPWICAENYDHSIQTLKLTEATICMGHFEIEGFQMYRGAPSHEGLEPKMFDKFDMVFSGHYHHKSSRGNIHYLGNPYELTWQDHDDPRGFHILDLKTQELEFIQNPNRMFKKLIYDDKVDDIKRPIDISIAEDFTEQEDMQDDDVDQAEDTTTILNKYVDNLTTDLEKDKIKTLLRELYVEALNEESE